MGTIKELPPLLSDKQVKFLAESSYKYNLAHGSMRSGKTVVTALAFLTQALTCPGEIIVMTGYSMNSIYTNVVSLIFGNGPLGVFSPFATWNSSGKLLLGPKTILCKGCGDEGALGTIQGMTIDLAYCDEMTLYPDSVIDTLQTRLSQPHSRLFASMNPKGPNHKLKGWIDKSGSDDQYYAQHFTPEDNPYLSEAYKRDLQSSLSGVFYKRNWLGLWCMAEGAIYDFFDKGLHVVRRPPKAAEYWIAGVDHGTRNAYCCLLIGINTGRFDQQGAKSWVEKEYYWDSVKQGRQKTNPEYVEDMHKFLGDYGVKCLYVDPAAAEFKLEMRRAGFHVVDANNEVVDGIQSVARQLHNGSLVICDSCRNLIAEIEEYVWDDKAAQKGDDSPLKKEGVRDHACDALRYAVHTHKIPKTIGA